MSFETLIVILFICGCLWNLQRNAKKIAGSGLAHGFKRWLLK